MNLLVQPQGEIYANLGSEKCSRSNFTNFLKYFRRLESFSLLALYQYFLQIFFQYFSFSGGKLDSNIDRKWVLPETSLYLGGEMVKKNHNGPNMGADLIRKTMK